MTNTPKLTVERNVFLKALSHSQTVVERRNTVPVLSHVLLDATAENLKLTATDLELSIIESIPAQITQKGKVTVSAHMLYEIVRKLPDGADLEIQVNSEKNQVEFQCGRSQFHLSYLPAEDFPVVQQQGLPCSFTLPAKHLLNLLDRTRFAMSQEETRYYLNGIYLHVFEGQELRAVATDGHRLAQVSVPLPADAESMPGIILPRKTVNEVLKLVTETSGDIRVSLSPTQISFEFAGVFLTSRLIDGTFPEYQKVIPASNDKKLSLDMEIFARAVDRVATISSEKNRGVKISLQEGKILLSANNNDIGRAEEEIEASYTSAPLEIGFNSKYLLDVAQQLNGKGAEFSIADAGSPVLIKEADDESSLFVIMPMRV